MWCRAAFNEGKTSCLTDSSSPLGLCVSTFLSQKNKSLLTKKQRNIIAMHLCAPMLSPSHCEMCCQSPSNAVFFLPLSCDWRDVRRKERRMQYNTNWGKAQSPAVHLQKFNGVVVGSKYGLGARNVTVQKLSKHRNFPICDSSNSPRLVLKWNWCLEHVKASVRLMAVPQIC